MHPKSLRRMAWTSLVLVLVLAAIGLPAGAQDIGNVDTANLVETGGVGGGSKTVAMPAPTVEQMEWSEVLPPLAPDQQKELEGWLGRSNRPGPERKIVENATLASLIPAPGSESILNASFLPTEGETSHALRAPGDAQVFVSYNLAAAIPSGYKSNILEASTALNGKFGYFTGNWFAARSINGGSTWNYISAYSGMSDFCCDQVTTFDEPRNVFFWLRMGVPNAAGSNRFRLGVSSNGGASFCSYNVRPTDVDSSWVGNSWDYPHIQLGADYLYMTWNMFEDEYWTRTIMLRWPLDALATCSGFDYDYYWNGDWFTFVPVEGADHVMYWASNYPVWPPYDRMRIWRWSENTDYTGIDDVEQTIPAWSMTNRGEAVCGAPNGNWAARTDDRLLTGARYAIQGTDDMVPGRKVLGWWWNVKQGGSYPYPYIDAAAFYEDTLTLVEGGQGRPLIWNSDQCFLYPSVSSNKRSDLGVVFHYGSGPLQTPSVGYAIADDYVAAPPGFTFYTVRTSNARPLDNVWGDYNTVRRFHPVETLWVAGSHYIAGSTNCSNCSSGVFFTFGRGRERNAWTYWRNK